MYYVSLQLAFDMPLQPARLERGPIRFECQRYRCLEYGYYEKGPRPHGVGPVHPGLSWPDADVAAEALTIVVASRRIWLVIAV